MVLADWRVIYERDPAARNWLEVLLCYPGLQSLVLHRVAHWFYKFGVPVLPRLIAHVNRFLTGIEIHPGAQIGKGVFIDHGMGVVIGETAIVGDYTLIYQGVTLGGTGKETGKRHPTLGRNVVVGAGANVLGNIHIGDNVRIGAASVVLRDVPSGSTVVGIPGRISRGNTAADALAHDSLRDMEAEVIRSLFERVKTLEAQINSLLVQPDATLAATKTTATAFHFGNGSHKMLSLDADADATETVGMPSEPVSNRGESDRLIEEFLDGAGI